MKTQEWVQILRAALKELKNSLPEASLKQLEAIIAELEREQYEYRKEMRY